MLRQQLVASTQTVAKSCQLASITCSSKPVVAHCLQSSCMRFYCQTCPYVQNIKETITKKLPLTRKKVDDVLGGEDAWKNVDQTEAPCKYCGNNRAYFMQIQIRSADEPMTIFFKCTKCAKMWSSN